MNAVVMIISFILALGMFIVFIARKIVESSAPPKEITPDIMHDLEIIVYAYYEGNAITKLFLALTIGGFIIAEIFHTIVNLGRV